MRLSEMAGLNKIMVIGNLGADPAMRYTPNGSPVASFSLATGRTYTGSDGEQKQETEWFNIVTWNQLAEQCNQFLTKGRQIYVEGRLKSNSWTGNDGQTRSRNEIIANRVLFLDRSGSQEPQQEQNPSPESDKPVGDVEDLPW